MAEQGGAELGNHLWRGGERLEVAKVPDRFTARLKAGVRPAEVERVSRAEHRRGLTRANVDEFAVDAAGRDAAMERLRRGDEVEFASHVYTLEGDPTSRLYLSDELTVQFKPDVADDEIERLAARVGLELIKAVQGVPHAYVFRLTPQASENPIKIANRLMATDRVVTAEPNVIVATQRFYVPSDTLFGEQWHLHTTTGPFLSPDAHIDAEHAWDTTRGERAVVVAIADDSCDMNHTDLQGQAKIVAARDFAGRDFAPLPESAGENHGTACAGVAVAEENGTGVVGVAPGCALMPIRTSGMVDDNAIEELFGWVIDHGASVVSCSWGPAAMRFPLSLRQSAALHRTASEGRGGLGCVIVFAAGNSNRPVDDAVDERGWPNDLLSGSTRWLNGFAAHPDVIAVSACTSLAKKAAYSCWGAQISVCAPSSNAHPSSYYPSVGATWTYPRITTPIVGRGIVTTDRVGPSGYSSTDYTRTFGGTSSASPTVAGVVGLVLSANPALTAAEVREVIERTADKIVDADVDPQLGLALGGYDANGHSPWFGYGKVNAFRAVGEAVRRRGDVAPAGPVLRRESAPGLDIPDGDPVGVRDSIAVAEPVTAAAVTVQVDLTHTYVGDLRLTLIAPGGQSIVLQDRQGARSRDLQRSFDARSTPGLAGLAGQPAQGAWTLQVQDLARSDVGQLRRWALELTTQASGAALELEDDAGLPIPDNDPAGIERRLEATGDGRIDDVSVSVDITHTNIGDLEVTLVPPSGQPVALHRRAGGTTDNLITTYRGAALAELRALRGQPLKGTWALRVADLEGRDVGKLNRWGLRLGYTA